MADRMQRARELLARWDERARTIKGLNVAVAIDTCAQELAAILQSSDEPSSGEALKDSTRLEWLLSKMTEAQLNDILGGYRVIVTTACARSAIDRALAAANGERGK